MENGLFDTDNVTNAFFIQKRKIKHQPISKERYFDRKALNLRAPKINCSGSAVSFKNIDELEINRIEAYRKAVDRENIIHEKILLKLSQKCVGTFKKVKICQVCQSPYIDRYVSIFCSKECSRVGYHYSRDYNPIIAKAKSQKDIDELRDHYIKKQLRKVGEGPFPDSLIELKREQLKLNRLINENRKRLNFS